MERRSESAPHGAAPSIVALRRPGTIGGGAGGDGTEAARGCDARTRGAPARLLTPPRQGSCRAEWIGLRRDRRLDGAAREALVIDHVDQLPESGMGVQLLGCLDIWRWRGGNPSRQELGETGCVGGLRIGRVAVGRPGAADDEPLGGSGHRDVEQSRRLGGGDLFTAPTNVAPSRGRKTKEDELGAAVATPEVDEWRRSRPAPAPAALALYQVDLAKLQPLRRVHGEDGDGVVAGVGRVRLLGRRLLGDRLAKRRQGMGRVESFAEPPLEIGEETLEVGEAEAAEETGGGDRLEQEAGPQLLDPERERRASRRRPQGSDRGDGRGERFLPAGNPIQSLDVEGNRRDGPLDALEHLGQAPLSFEVDHRRGEAGAP